jgi:putative NADH-flavin reductase
MKLLVFGATGPTGQEIVKQALAQGHEVTALARHPEALTLQHENLRVVQGDTLKPETLQTAVTGQDAVISALGTPLLRKPTTILSESTRNIVTAMKNSGVSRLIVITGIGAGDSKGHGGFVYDRIILPFLLNYVYDDKTRQEGEVEKSNLEWTIVRPAQLTNKTTKGEYQAFLEGDYKAKNISRADVADFVLKQLSSNRYLHQHPVISY